ncbi:MULTISPECIES: LysR family transcriptional regulator [Enterobacteriaceae]|jgi:DNA-binding transcriptional LysR family regulator|nr:MULTISPECIES: LysR family transcriptional regulator [Enterobacteriaceae]EHM4904050.1 LysR family transcriptional regulator [Salmonella enterica]
MNTMKIALYDRIDTGLLSMVGDMEIHQLRIFVYVATELSYRRAAKKLNMTQPPLTRQIQQLERSLNTPLFKRSTRKVELTEAGKALLNEADKIITLVEGVASRVQLRAQGCSGELVIGIFSWGVINHLPDYLKILRKLKPYVNVRLKNLSKEKQIEALRNGEIDIGFCRFAVSQSGIDIGTIKDEKYLVAVSADNKLSMQPQINLTDLADEPMILYPVSSLAGMAQKVYDAFHSENVRLNISNYCEDIMTSLLLVSGGYGSCITTQWAENINMPGVVYRPLIAKKLMHSPLNYIFRSDIDNVLVRDFIQIIQSLSSIK